MTTVEAATMLSIRAGHTMLLDEQLLRCTHYLSVQAGLIRVAVSKPDQEALQAQLVPLGFLQAGDHLPLDLLRNSRLHLQALMPTSLVRETSALPPVGSNSLHDWTLALLMLRHQGEAEQRIQALLQLLVERLGRRSGNWYEIPFPLTHAELAELSGHSRATVTRQLAHLREQGLIEQDPGPNRNLRIAPVLVDA